MDDVTLAYAKEHLDELVARAAAGEDVRIKTPDRGTIRLPSAGAGGDSSMRPGGRGLGLLSGKNAIPARLMEPMTEDELADWYGETARGCSWTRMRFSGPRSLPQPSRRLR